MRDLRDTSMLKKTTALPLLVALAFASGAQAQTAAAPAATASTSGPAANGANAPGAPYVKSTSGDWELRCVHTKDGHDPCQLYQLVKDKTNNPVAEFAVTNLPAGQQAVLGGTIVTPLETMLPPGVHLKIDSDTEKSYGFLFCSSTGCVSRVGFTAKEEEAMKKGKEITMTIVPVAAPNQPVQLTVSLKGFTDGLAQVTKINEANRAAAGKLSMPPTPTLPSVAPPAKK